MDIEIRSLAYDSRRVEAGALFFAVRGEITDGNRFVADALRRGAVAVASEIESPPSFPSCWIRVPAVRPFMAELADRFYGEPSAELKLIGVTGTNGKTTTAFLVHSVLSLDAPSLLMGTIRTTVGDESFDSERTTPESVDLQQTLRRALDRGCRTGVMEVSSHALQLQRVHRTRFPVCIFTNLTRDHLDFHGSFSEYFEAKRKLFDSAFNPGLKEAILNRDDLYAGRLNPAPGVRISWFGAAPGADVRPRTSSTSVEGTRLELDFFGRRLRLESPLIGDHNVFNIMAAAAACSRLGIPDPAIQAGIAALDCVPGRFEKVEIEHDFTVVIDYAHTPDALKNVLALARTVCRRRVLCVFGCGGGRDRSKRPLMGELAVRMSDLAIITSDNPRHEQPEAIIEEIRCGIPGHLNNFRVVADRREAIACALELAKPGDLILIAGKGHENYQEIQGSKIHFDDREVVRELA